jgi:hypothetical protein
MILASSLRYLAATHRTLYVLQGVQRPTHIGRRTKGHLFSQASRSHAPFVCNPPTKKETEGSKWKTANRPAGGEENDTISLMIAA